MVHWVLMFWFFAILAAVIDLSVYGLLARLRPSRSLRWLVAFQATATLELIFALVIQYAASNLESGNPVGTVARLLHFLVLGGYLLVVPRLVWALRSWEPPQFVQVLGVCLSGAPAFAYVLLLSLEERSLALRVEPVVLIAVFMTLLYQAAKLRIHVAEIRHDMVRRWFPKVFPFFLGLGGGLFLLDVGSWWGVFGIASSLVAMVSGPAVFLVMHLGFLLVGVGSLVRLGVSRPKSIQDSDFSRWRLSPRECEVAVLVLDGLTNAQIASSLFVSERTVKNHVYNIYQKTGVESRVGLVNLVRGSESTV